MFHQLLAPVALNLPLSVAVAAIPIVTVLVMLGVIRLPAWVASLGGLAVAFALATLIWKLPLATALSATAAGITFGLWPVMWIVVNALLLYNICVVTGRFDAFRDWMLEHLPDDRRIILVVVGFCFGGLLEGVAGFGAPVAITSALLIALGFQAREALTYTLIFNTAPVAFGALGAPIATLGTVTHLSDVTLGAMVGRQLPFIALLLPFYVTGMHGGRRSLAALWPVLLVAGASFAVTQFLVSNFVSYNLTDVVSSLGSLLVTLGFLRVWRPRLDPAFSLSAQRKTEMRRGPVAPWQGWIPWVVVCLVVIFWTMFKVAQNFDVKVPWPHLHNAVFITLYQSPYSAIWDFQPLATGSAILLAALLTALILGCGVRSFIEAIALTARQSRLTIVTVGLIVGLAYLMNYSGMNYTLGLGVASAGLLFPLLSAFLGWVAVFLSGSDTSGNALFGNLQVVAAHQLNLNPVLIAATNSSGGVMGKMISPQNIATGASVTSLKGQEGSVLATTFKHSVILTLILGGIVLLQQYVMPWMLPH
jgi:lactate permease